MQPDIKTPMGEVLIRFADVKKSFGPKEVYKGLDIVFRRGETTTVMGPSGTGKSVLLKMLIGLISVDSGSIVFDGEEITRMSERKLFDVRRRVAYLFQGAALFDSMSVGDNVAYGLREQYWATMPEKDIAERVDWSLEAVGLPGIEAMRFLDFLGGM